MALNHILSASLSNSLQSLNLIVEHSFCSGIGKIFLRKMLESLRQKYVLLILDRSSLDIFSDLVVVRQEIGESCALNLIPTLSEEARLPEIPSDFVVVIDNICQFEYWFGQERSLDLVKQRIPTGVIGVINESYMNSIPYRNISNIFIEVLSYDSCHGICKTVHKRGSTRLSISKTNFSLRSGVISVEKNSNATQEATKPVSSFRLGTSKEEEEMRKKTPLPYEQRLITVDPEDYISSDEDGDEDDYYA